MARFIYVSQSFADGWAAYSENGIPLPSRANTLKGTHLNLVVSH